MASRFDQITMAIDKPISSAAHNSGGSRLEAVVRSVRDMAFVTTDHIIVQDLDLRYRAVVNPQLGMTEAGMLGKTDQDLISDPGNLGPLVAAKRKVMDTGEPEHLSASLFNASGEREHFDGTYVAIRGAGGVIEGLVGFFRNVTAQRRTEGRLKMLGEQMRIFISESPVAVAMFDREMRYLQVSRRWVEDYHLQGRDILGRSHYEIFPEIPESWKDVHRRCLAGERLQAEADHFQRPDGSVQWVHWIVHPWHGESGEVGGILIFAEDITTQRNAEESLVKRNAELEQALAHVKTLAGLIPICSSCKKVRDDRNFWSQVEIYVSRRTDAKFSHTLCPDCLPIYFPDSVDPR